MSRSGDGGDHALDPALARRHTQASKLANRRAKTPAGSAAGNETRRLAFSLDQKWRNGGSARRCVTSLLKKSK
jgi:hypothetical protein